MKHPERILIVRLSHLGDVACALGVFHALHEAYPAAEIGWAVQPEFAGLLEGLPGIERIFRFESDGAVLTSDSTLRFREREEVVASLAQAGFALLGVRDAPDRPGRELVFVARVAR